MKREEFEKKFPQNYLDELIETAFQFLRKNKKASLQLRDASVVEYYDTADHTTECKVKISYYNGHEVHSRELIELLFTEDFLLSDEDNGADKIKDKKTKLILRIAWRIWKHELQCQAGNANGMN